MRAPLRQTLWFLGLWIFGVCVLGLAAYGLRSVLKLATG